MVDSPRQFSYLLLVSCPQKTTCFHGGFKGLFYLKNTEREEFIFLFALISIPNFQNFLSDKYFPKIKIPNIQNGFKNSRFSFKYIVWLLLKYLTKFCTCQNKFLPFTNKHMVIHPVNFQINYPFRPPKFNLKFCWNNHVCNEFPPLLYKKLVYQKFTSFSP